MKTKHTPGPWQVLTDTKELTNITKNISTAYYEYRIVNDLEGAITSKITDSKNAALIAAAPEMLEALESLLKLADVVLQKEGSRDCSIRLMARQALQKARGE